jgi:phage/plasmid-like protein (TIGR03299 family)
MRTDTGEVLGIVREYFTPVQNRDAFSFFDAAVSDHKATYEAAGSIGLGERIWILARLPDVLRVKRNDIVNKYLLLTNSHDGGFPLRVRLTPIRVVCNNTLASDALESEEAEGAAVPTPPRQGDQATALLALSDSLYGDLEVVYNEMAAMQISSGELIEYVHAVLPDSNEEEGALKDAEIRNEVLRLHDSGMGSALARGTLWGAFNSITEYTDHAPMDLDPAGRLHSIWFGPGERLKRKAFRLAVDMLRRA